jgi:TonB family protein
MNIDVGSLLLETTLAGSAAVIVVLGSRQALRAAFGAGAAYASWALVPVALLAVLLPAATAPMLPDIAGAAPVRAGLGSLVAAAGGKTIAPQAWLFAAWALGAALLFALQAARQRRFRRDLGPLHRRADGHLQAQASAGLPAVLGWPARIVLPADFDRRYDAAERELVLCHESVHLRRGDLPASAFVALLRCVFWFNPLVHVAAARFRHDQELACDAAVLRRFPDARRRYGDALLKTELTEVPLPVGCHWFGVHPLKERILMLKKPLPSKARWIAGLVVTTVLSLAGGMAAWAAQPATALEPGPGEILVSLDVRIDGGASQVASAIVVSGESHDFRFANEGETWLLTVEMTQVGDDGFDMRSEVRRGDTLVGEPRLLFGATGAAIAIGDKNGAGFDGIEIGLQARSGRDAARPAAAAMMSAVGIDGPAPRYPATAAATGESGTVLLLLSIDAEGRVLRSEVEPEGSTVAVDSALARSAQAASMQWKLEPAIEDGKPVASQVLVPVRFEPDRKPDA